MINYKTNYGSMKFQIVKDNHKGNFISTYVISSLWLLHIQTLTGISQQKLCMLLLMICAQNVSYISDPKQLINIQMCVCLCVVLLVCTLQITYLLPHKEKINFPHMQNIRQWEMQIEEYVSEETKIKIQL